jgi:hypothetical protein
MEWQRAMPETCFHEKGVLPVMRPVLPVSTETGLELRRLMRTSPANTKMRWCGGGALGEDQFSIRRGPLTSGIRNPPVFFERKPLQRLYCLKRGHPLFAIRREMTFIHGSIRIM